MVVFVLWFINVGSWEFYLNLLQASHTCINEPSAVVRGKNGIFFVDGVGRFLGRSFYYEVTRKNHSSIIRKRKGERKLWAGSWVIFSQLSTSFLHRKNISASRLHSESKCITLAGEADSGLFIFSFRKTAYHRCHLTGTYSGDATYIYIEKINTQNFIRCLGGILN